MMRMMLVLVLRVGWLSNMVVGSQPADAADAAGIRVAARGGAQIRRGISDPADWLFLFFGGEWGRKIN